MQSVHILTLVFGTMTVEVWLKDSYELEHRKWHGQDIQELERVGGGGP